MINVKSSASVVLYQHDYEEISSLIEDILALVNADFKIYIVDNSPTDHLNKLSALSPQVEYISNPSNPGFGAAHNVALKKAFENHSKYHFVINPDVVLHEDVVSPMVEYMEKNPQIGMMMPQILNDDGTVQNLPKLLPSTFSVFMRKFKKPKFYYEKFINNYELRKVKKDVIYNAPILSGCFTLFRMSAVKEVGVYDDRFFMYFEDWDLSRRMHSKYKTIYYPKVSVVHGYESGANKDKRLFKIFVRSAIHYFNKWGWFFDGERNKINKKTLQQF